MPEETEIPEAETRDPSGMPDLELLFPQSAGQVREAELDAALSDDAPGGGGIAPPDVAPTSGGAGQGAASPPADFKPWSPSRRQRADRKAMRQRIEQLEGMILSGQVRTSPAADAPADDVALPPEALEAIARESIAKTLRVIGGIAKRVRGDHWELTEAECAALGGAWAPVAAPYLGGVAAHLPLVGALAVTAEVFWPRIEADMNAAKLSATPAAELGAVAE